METRFSLRSGLMPGERPSTTTTSAYLPGSRDPRSFSMPMALAPLTVTVSRSSCADRTVGSHRADFWRRPNSLISAMMSSVLLVVDPSVPRLMFTPAARSSGTGGTPPVASFMLEAGQEDMDIP